MTQKNNNPHVGVINDPIRVNGSISIGESGVSTSVNNSVEVNGHMQVQECSFKKKVNVNGAVSFNQAQLEDTCTVQGTIQAQNSIFSNLYITGQLDNLQSCKITNLHVSFPKWNLFFGKKRQIILENCEIFKNIEVEAGSLDVSVILRGKSILHGNLLGAKLIHESNVQ